MATRFAAANAAQPSSSQLRRSQAIADVPHRLDLNARPELLPQPADADIDDVRARVEVVAPDVGEQALAADRVARVLHQLLQQSELAVGEGGDLPIHGHGPTREAERETARADEVPVGAGPGAELDPHTGDQLVEGEGLREVVARPELEPAELRRQVGPGGEDQDRELRTAVLELTQEAEPV